MSTIERRMLPADEMPLDIEEREGGLPIIRGMAAVYNKPSRDLGGFREVILPGAFDHILERKYKKMDVVALWNHDANQLLGRTSSGTLRLSSDERGLKYELDPPATTLARDLMTLVRRSPSRFPMTTNRTTKHPKAPCEPFGRFRGFTTLAS